MVDKQSRELHAAAHRGRGRRHRRARANREEDEAINGDHDRRVTGARDPTSERTSQGPELSAVDRSSDYLELARGLERIGSISAEMVDDAAALARELERLRDHVDGYRDEEVDAESLRPPE